MTASRSESEGEATLKIDNKEFTLRYRMDPVSGKYEMTTLTRQERDAETATALYHLRKAVLTLARVVDETRGLWEESEYRSLYEDWIREAREHVDKTVDVFKSLD